MTTHTHGTRVHIIAFVVSSGFALSPIPFSLYILKIVQAKVQPSVELSLPPTWSEIQITSFEVSVRSLAKCEAAPGEARGGVG